MMWLASTHCTTLLSPFHGAFAQTGFTSGTQLVLFMSQFGDAFTSLKFKLLFAPLAALRCTATHEPAKLAGVDMPGAILIEREPEFLDLDFRKMVMVEAQFVTNHSEELAESNQSRSIRIHHSKPARE